MAEARTLAVIDLGSNACRLALFEHEGGRRFRQIDELREPVRLGAGLGKDNILRAEAFDRGVAALRAFRTYCDAVGADEVRATATSAVRDAANREAFLAAVRERAGLELEVLSGEEEARLGALAVANSFAIRDAFVLDIGGGSAQLSRLGERRFAAGRSWPIGAVRMTEAFLLEDPPKRKHLAALQHHVRELLSAGAPEGFGGGLPLVGMGGTIRNLAKIRQTARGELLAPIHGYALELAHLEELIELFAKKPVAERRGISGLSSERADVILAGAVVAREVLSASGAPALVVSGQGLREGLFYERFLRHQPEPLIEDVRALAVENLALQHHDHPEHHGHVRRLALELFDQLQPLHQRGTFERELLAAAAVVHDIGMAVEYHQHHRHGMYLVMAAGLPGYSHREQALIALLVAHHRKGKIAALGLESLLEPGDLERVAISAGCLRLAEHLERAKAQRVTGVRCVLGQGYVLIQARGGGDLEVEVRAASAHKELLATSLGVQLEVVAAGA